MKNVSSILEQALFLAICLIPAAQAVEPAKSLATAPAPAAPSQPSPARGIAGEVVSVDGTAFVRPDGVATQGAPGGARPGDPVYAGDVVNTASNGKIKILMKDKSIVDLGPSALFKVDHFDPSSGNDRQVDVTLVYGTLRGAVTKKLTGAGRFKVRTPSATMGVRGTEFVVKSDMAANPELKKAAQNVGRAMASLPQNSKTQSKTEITVLQGKVEVAKFEGLTKGLKGSPQVVPLTAGSQITTRQNDAQLAKPVTLDTQKLAALSTQVKVQDNTFSKAVVIEPPSENSGNSPVGGGASSSNSSAQARGPASSAAPSSSSSGGEATKSILVAAINVPAAPPPIPAADLNLPGTFGASRPAPPAPINPQNGMKKVRITLVK